MIVKVIFHIDENFKWGLLLKNVKNLTKAVELNASKIEVLANSEAVKAYVNTTLNVNTALIKELANLGIHFTACNNALNGFGIHREQLETFVEVVPIGVLELIEKQANGYAYIKP